MLHARDKATGAVLAEVPLPGAVGGLPMTFMLEGEQYIVLSVAGSNCAEMIALTL